MGAGNSFLCVFSHSSLPYVFDEINAQALHTRDLLGHALSMFNPLLLAPTN
jgi:hypothetical protein